MTLQEKLDTINLPLLKNSIGLLNVGKADTISEFFLLKIDYPKSIL